MGREIKFRAWDKENHEMVDLSTHGKLQYNGIDGPKLVFGTDWHDDLYDSETEDFELMQCTGLKDKHGRDIYEGDIVQLDSGIKELKLSTVIWQNGKFVIKSSYSPKYIDLDFWVAFRENQVEYVEVLGNIYENSELLEKKEAQ